MVYYLFLHYSCIIHIISYHIIYCYVITYNYNCDIIHLSAAECFWDRFQDVIIWDGCHWCAHLIWCQWRTVGQKLMAHLGVPNWCRVTHVPRVHRVDVQNLNMGSKESYSWVLDGFQSSLAFGGCQGVEELTDVPTREDLWGSTDQEIGISILGLPSI